MRKPRRGYSMFKTLLGFKRIFGERKTKRTYEEEVMIFSQPISELTEQQKRDRVAPLIIVLIK
jgi:hypothetical protein